MNEFSYLVPLDRLGSREVVEQLCADPGACAALAERFGLLSLVSLTATVRLRRVSDRGLYAVRGRFSASVEQACVVSLEPVSCRLEESFELLYSTAPADAVDVEAVVDIDAEDPPEAVGPEGIDIGEAVAQQLAMALNPYPRREDARSPAEYAAGDEAVEESPFAGLRALRADS
jgi:uncharacterized metal-binding protein YceD (DUF177 family)